MQWIADTIFSVPTLRAFTPRIISRTALELMRRSAVFLEYTSTGSDGRVGWIELQNKLEAFSLFEYVDFELGAETTDTLLKLVAGASRLGRYRSIWAMEGVGHHYANLQCRSGRIPDKLLHEESTGGLPPASLVPLHTGMGLALAEGVLGSVDREPAKCSEFIDTLMRLCRENSREGYAGAAFEALGLVARILYPRLIEAINHYLSQNNTLLAYFWHGIGRGTYFSPEYLLPFCSKPWQAVEMGQREAPHETGRRNTLAGLAWALTLVNIRHPEIIAAFLKYHAAQVSTNDAFANGVCSALVVWRQVSPEDPYIEALQRYVPPDGYSPPPGLWNQCVTQSCHRALSYQQVPMQTAIGEVFRYQ